MGQPKRLTRNQRLQRSKMRLHAELDLMEDFAAGLLVILDTIAKELPPGRYRALLSAVDEKRAALGFPTSQEGME